MFYISEEEYQRRIRAYNEGTLEPTRKEKLIINPLVAVEVTSEDVANFVPKDYLINNRNALGDVSRVSYQSPVDNMIWDFLYFVNPDVFRPAALAYIKSMATMARGSKVKGRYTSFPRGSKPYNDFWREEARRCKEGYEPIVDGKPCGIYIPGEFYFYLNYAVVAQKVVDPNNPLKEVEAITFPKFLAVDYYYNKELHLREKPHLYGKDSSWKLSLVLLKARRMGFSYKAGSGSVYMATFNKNTVVMIAGYQFSDAEVCFNKSKNIINFISDNTPFGLEDIGEPRNNGGWKHAPIAVDKFKYEIINTRKPERKGRLSEIKLVTLYNNDHAISGEGLGRLYFEEAGKTKNLKRGWLFAKPAMMIGDTYRNGIAVIFGTGGEMEKGSGKEGSTVDFKEIFYNPSTYGIADYHNIYEYEEGNGRCGLFFPAMWFYPTKHKIEVNGIIYPSIDERGNPLFWAAELALNIGRAKALESSRADYELELTQLCKTPSEAFLITKSSRFQLTQLIERDSEIRKESGGYDRIRVPIKLSFKSDNTVEAEIDLSLKPVLPASNSSVKEGCVLRYRSPRSLLDRTTGNTHIPEDAYMISVDPIGVNSPTGSSLIAIIVFNTGKYPELGAEGIVATYYGRPSVNPVGYMCELLHKLAVYYNCKITFENDRGGEEIMNYFKNRNKLNLLMGMPKHVIAANIKYSKSTSHRYFGHSMSSESHKEAAARYIYEWLDKVNHEPLAYNTESGMLEKPVERTNLFRLEDEMLINQLMQYTNSGNYDAVSAFMGIMLQMEEVIIREKYKNKSSFRDKMIKNAKDLIAINSSLKY